LSGSAGSGGSETALNVNAALDPSGCSLSTTFETWSVTHADGTPVELYTCQWTFDDGGGSDLCSGPYTFSSPGFHSGTVTVSEVGTSATGTDTSANVPIWDELTIDVVAQAPACGLTFSYTTTKSGGKPSGGFTFASIQPWENVITPGPWPGSATIEVSAAGTYTITVYREEETSYSLCTATDSTQVSVSACP
jgi:hypothetical protein